MIMHLRRYREIQISLGHNIGDEVLRMASMKVREQLEEEPVLARLDGGRFLIVLRNTDEQRAYSIARNLTSVIDHGLSAKGVNLTLEACTGIAICPYHGTEQAELLRKAAIAKNDAYQQHDRIRVYQKGRESSHLRRLAILGDMRRAGQS